MEVPLQLYARGQRSAVPLLYQEQLRVLGVIWQVYEKSLREWLSAGLGCFDFSLLAPLGWDSAWIINSSVVLVNCRAQLVCMWLIRIPIVMKIIFLSLHTQWKFDWITSNFFTLIYSQFFPGINKVIFH